VEKIKVIHDAVGKTLTVWIDDPKKEAVCEETADEIVVMKDRKGRIIGFELLHYKPANRGRGIVVETLIRSQPE
jgi:hypothetical protein